MSFFDGNTQSVLLGSVSNVARQRTTSSHSLGCIGIVRVAVFFFVHALGVTTAVGVTFSHLRLRASLIRAAVNLHAESTALHSGLSSAMSTSRRSLSKISAWLSIGPEAQAAAATCFTKTLCHPHHPRGCLCLKPGVAHVVRTLPKYDAVARAAGRRSIFVRWNHISAGLLISLQRPGLRGWTTGRRRFRR